MINLKSIRNLDYAFVGVVALLLTLGLLVLSSATLNVGIEPWSYVKRQLLWILIGLAAAGMVMLIDYNSFQQYSRWLYGFNLLFLFSVLVLGQTIKGGQQWLRWGGLGIQPSEIVKILLIVTLGSFLLQRERIETWRDLVPVGLYIGAPLLLIMLQPDLGTALVYIAISLGMVYVAGIRTGLLLKVLAGVALVVAVAMIGHFKFGLPLPLEEYQLKRLIVFIDPYMDGRGGRGAGWHVIQSLIAIGSGGFWGKGLFRGTQIQGNFLPEHHTDFIFSVVGEEMGFIGAAGILFLYFLLLYRALRIAQNARDKYGILLVVGIVSMWGFHIFENIGMAMGIMPVTGIPLPFLSYGGSAMLANLMGVGLLLNINLRRQRILF